MEQTLSAIPMVNAKLATPALKPVRGSANPVFSPGQNRGSRKSTQPGPVELNSVAVIVAKVAQDITPWRHQCHQGAFQTATTMVHQDDHINILPLTYFPCRILYSSLFKPHL